MKILSPTGEVFPYAEQARAYLQAGAGANVGEYSETVNDRGLLENPQVAVRIAWEPVDAEKYLVEYATKADYSDGISAEVSGERTSIEVYNLYKATEYYLRVTAQGKDGEVLSVAESVFRTTELGPRVMHVDGIYNVRDLGGYLTKTGKRTAQGLLYRGGSLTPADIYEPDLTETGKKYMRENMGIRTEIDFRSPSESGVTESPIPSATLVSLPIGAYKDGLGNENYRRLFEMLSCKENYPIYVHCTGGADRTGTVSFLINALLGVAERELVQDYEFTSFSVFGERNTQTGVYSPMYTAFREALDGYAGSDLQEKAESYALSLGVTKAQIERFRLIFTASKEKQNL